MKDLQKAGPLRSQPVSDGVSNEVQTRNHSFENAFKKDAVVWLFSVYGGKRGIPRPRGAKALSEDCRRLGVNISQGTFRNIFTGTTAELAEDTKQKLAELFRRAIPEMKPNWFDPRTHGDNPLEKFKNLCLSEEHGESQLVIRVPRISQERLDIYKEWLCGIYICYRYSFEINYDDSVTREILRVWYDVEEGIFKFQLWYVVGGAKPGSSVESFDGAIILVGDMIMFAGISRDRARSLFWTYDSGDEIIGHFKHCRFGITASAKARDDRAPVAACTVCVKLEKTPKDWQWWCSKYSMVIGVDTFRNIIGVDFRDENNHSDPSERTSEQWVGQFMENKPMTKSETEHEAEDRILRLNMKRFRIRMDQIRNNMIRSNKLTPFNAIKWEKEQRAETRSRTENGNIAV